MPECLECGKAFSARVRRQRCCSSDCGQIWRRKQPKNREKARQAARLWYVANPERAKAYRLSRRKGPQHLVCERCQKPFLLSLGRARFCSAACRAKQYKVDNPQSFVAAKERYREKGNARCKANYYKTRASTPWKPLLLMAKHRAKIKNIPFTLTVAWAEKRWNSRCELTGLPFDLGRNKRGLFSPSIDQIIAGAGYTPDNCRFILWAVNAMKGEGTETDVLKIAQAIMASTARLDL